jgi:hypothetical protein
MGHEGVGGVGRETRDFPEGKTLSCTGARLDLVRAVLEHTQQQVTCKHSDHCEVKDHCEGTWMPDRPDFSEVALCCSPFTTKHAPEFLTSLVCIAAARSFI